MNELQWRKSSYSNGSGGACVELAETADGIAVRNSNHPDAGTLTVSVADMAALMVGVKAGDYDDLTA